MKTLFFLWVWWKQGYPWVVWGQVMLLFVNPTYWLHLLSSLLRPTFSKTVTNIWNQLWYFPNIPFCLLCAHQAPLSTRILWARILQWCHALRQRIFPTQGLNLGFPHCRWILYELSYEGSPFQWHSVLFNFQMFIISLLQIL